MLKSYVGLASPNGLEVLLPESQLVVDALTALARPKHAVCWWAVLTATTRSKSTNDWPPVKTPPRLPCSKRRPGGRPALAANDN